jgi:hypothetical protein
MIYTHVLESAAAGTSSPLDGLMLAMDVGAADGVDHRMDSDADDDDAADAVAPRVREPAFPCYLATPSSTARATSAS